MDIGAILVGLLKGYLDCLRNEKRGARRGNPSCLLWDWLLYIVHRIVCVDCYNAVCTLLGWCNK